jgi:outer membrane lipoprotein-sorting protein
MHRARFVSLTLLVLLLPAVVPAARAQTVEEILARSAEARGGADRLAAVDTIVGTGTALLGGQIEAPFRYEWKRPNRFRFELTLQGVTEVQASDGTTAWRLDPSDQPEPEPMAAFDLAMLNDAADFLGALVNPEAKGHEVELVGRVEVEGTPAWELRVTRAEGFLERIYLDFEHLIEIQELEEHPLPSGGEPVVLVTNWGDYKEVGGLLLPHYWSRYPRANPADVLTLTFDSLKLGETIPDERFSMPGAEGESASK